MMAELCLMASHGYPPGLVVSQEQQSVSRAIRDLQPFLPGGGARPDIIRSGSLTLSPVRLKEAWEPLSGLLEKKGHSKIDSMVKYPLILDLKDAYPTSVPLSAGIAERSMMHKEVFDFSTSGLSDTDKTGVDTSRQSDFRVFQAVAKEIHNLPIIPSLIYPCSQFSAENPLSDFLGDLARSSKITIDSDGRVLVTDSGAEMKDLLSIVAEFYLSKSSTMGRKLSMPIPYFNREIFNRRRANIHGYSSKCEAAAVAPVKSPEKTKLKQSARKKNAGKAGRGRDLFKRNYFHTCESLLSILVDKRRQGKTAVLSLKKAGPELPELLNQFSAGIAGTGLAVVFSVLCKLACGRVPFCASKLFSTGFGFGLVWLSSAVNRLRDTVIDVSKNSGKLGLKEEEMMRKVDKSVSEIYFRAAAIMAVAVLRFV